MRLTNWARWANAGNNLSLGYPEWYDIWSQYLPNNHVGLSYAENDAQHIENIITTLDMCSRRDPDTFVWGCLWAYVIKLEHLWMPCPVEVRAKFVRYKFKRPCAKRTYHKHVERATDAIFILAKEL